MQTLLADYRAMRLIREFEERVIRLVNENSIAGVTHEYIGQEAVAVGVCANLEASDYLTSTHRGHGHLLARGANPARMMAELFARVEGLNRGRGGSMYIADVSLGILGANGMVGAGAPIACGAAWASPGAVAVAFFGDGALNQGVLLESMNLAAAWKLPVIFCCENNGYAVTTPRSDSMVVTPYVRAAGMGMPGATVDGMDVQATREAARRAVEHARNGLGPYFLDCVCYRFQGHHTAESAMKLSYRTDAELKSWQLKDPLVKAWNVLRAGGVKAMEITAIDREIATVIDRAVEFAVAGTTPDDADAMDYAYASGVSARFPEWGARQ